MSNQASANRYPADSVEAAAPAASFATVAKWMSVRSTTCPLASVAWLCSRCRLPGALALQVGVGDRVADQDVGLASRLDDREARRRGDVAEVDVATVLATGQRRGGLVRRRQTVEVVGLLVGRTARQGDTACGTIGSEGEQDRPADSLPGLCSAQNSIPSSSAISVWPSTMDSRLATRGLLTALNVPPDIGAKRSPAAGRES